MDRMDHKLEPEKENIENQKSVKNSRTKMKIWQNCKVDKVENSKDWKSDKIKNSTKLNVRQNWKLDETEN